MKAQKFEATSDFRIYYLNAAEDSFNEGASMTAMLCV